MTLLQSMLEKKYYFNKFKVDFKSKSRLQKGRITKHNPFNFYKMLNFRMFLLYLVLLILVKNYIFNMFVFPDMG